jgi:hypothetical protein
MGPPDVVWQASERRPTHGRGIERVPAMVRRPGAWRRGRSRATPDPLAPARRPLVTAPRVTARVTSGRPSGPTAARRGAGELGSAGGITPCAEPRREPKETRPDLVWSNRVCDRAGRTQFEPGGPFADRPAVERTCPTRPSMTQNAPRAAARQSFCRPSASRYEESRRSSAKAIQRDLSANDVAADCHTVPLRRALPRAATWTTPHLGCDHLGPQQRAWGSPAWCAA